jgi:hypothetical protein
MLERLVSITNLFEEVDLILPGEKSCADTVDGGISPSFVVESTLLVQMLEIFGVCFAAPKVEITNLKVTPDYSKGQKPKLLKEWKLSYNDIDYSYCLRHPK